MVRGRLVQPAGLTGASLVDPSGATSSEPRRSSSRTRAAAVPRSAPLHARATPATLLSMTVRAGARMVPVNHPDTCTCDHCNKRKGQLAAVIASLSAPESTQLPDAVVGANVAQTSRSLRRKPHEDTGAASSSSSYSRDARDRRPDRPADEHRSSSRDGSSSYGGTATAPPSTLDLPSAPAADTFAMVDFDVPDTGSTAAILDAVKGVHTDVAKGSVAILEDVKQVGKDVIDTKKTVNIGFKELKDLLGNIARRLPPAAAAADSSSAAVNAVDHHNPLDEVIAGGMEDGQVAVAQAGDGRAGLTAEERDTLAILATSLGFKADGYSHRDESGVLLNPHLLNSLVLLGSAHFDADAVSKLSFFAGSEKITEDVLASLGEFDFAKANATITKMEDAPEAEVAKGPLLDAAAVKLMIPTVPDIIRGMQEDGTFKAAVVGCVPDAAALVRTAVQDLQAESKTTAAAFAKRLDELAELQRQQTESKATAAALAKRLDEMAETQRQQAETLRLQAEQLQSVSDKLDMLDGAVDHMDEAVTKSMATMTAVQASLAQQLPQASTSPSAVDRAVLDAYKVELKTAVDSNVTAFENVVEEKLAAVASAVEQGDALMKQRLTEFNAHAERMRLAGREKAEAPEPEAAATKKTLGRLTLQLQRVDKTVAVLEKKAAMHTEATEKTAYVVTAIMTHLKLNDSRDSYKEKFASWKRKREEVDASAAAAKPSGKQAASAAAAKPSGKQGAAAAATKPNGASHVASSSSGASSSSAALLDMEQD